MPPIQSPTLKFFADFIERETGIIYSDDNAYQLESRLIQLSKHFNLGGIPDLHDKGQKEGIHGEFKQALLDIATNNETSFFRDPKIFSAFQKTMITSFKGAPIRVWSAACSFGQEPYTLALVLEELRLSGVSMPDVEITASDISIRAIEKAKDAIYTHIEIQRGLPAVLMLKYFEKVSDDHWKLKDVLRRKVRFQRVNLLDISGVSGKFQIIFCRNVLIYQNDDKKKEIIDKITDYLVPGGILVLGAAESMIGFSDRYEQIAFESTIFYKKK